MPCRERVSREWHDARPMSSAPPSAGLNPAQLEALLLTSKDAKLKDEHIQLAEKVAAIEEKWMALQGDLEQLEGGAAK